MRLQLLVALAAAVDATSPYFQQKFQSDTFYQICKKFVIANDAAVADCKASNLKVAKGASDIVQLEARAAAAKVNDACVCQLDNIVRSIYQCIETFASNSTDHKAIKHSWSKYDRYCEYNKAPLMYTLPEVQAAIAANPIKQTYAQATNSTTGAFKLPAKSFSEANQRAGEDFYFQYTRNDYYGWATMIYIFGIMVIQMALHLLHWTLPSVTIALANSKVGRAYRKFFALPALFNGHASEPIEVGNGAISMTLPPRMHSLLLIGYLTLVIVLSCYNYPVTLAAALQANAPYYNTMVPAIRTGTMAMYTMPMLFLFGGRNNFMIWLTGWNHEQFMIWHRWIARVFLLQSLAHSILYGHYQHLKSGMGKFADSYMVAGVIATVALFIICVQSSRVIRRLSYEAFRTIHTLFGICFLVAMYYHLIKTGVGFAQYWVPVGLWIFDRLIRVVRILVSNPAKTRALITVSDEDVMSIEVTYSGLWKPKASQYVYLYFLDWKNFYQCHPFSVIPIEGKPNKFRLVTKVMNGVTKAMQQKVLANGGELDQRVLVEGPYGTHFNPARYQEYVLIGGGIGFTAVCSQFASIAAQATENQLIQILWVVRHHNALKWFPEELAAMAAKKNTVVKIFITHTDLVEVGGEAQSIQMSEKSREDSSDSELVLPGVIFEDTKPDLKQYIEATAAESRGPVCVFTCGGHGLNDDVRQGCINGLKLTRNHIDFHEESFTF